MSIDPIKSTENIENVLKVAINQNFIPVEDDNGTFIGIIKRKDVIQYCSEQLFKSSNFKSYFHQSLTYQREY